MLFGRIVGWLMMYCGVGLLLQYPRNPGEPEWLGGPPPDPWNIQHESLVEYLERALTQSLSQSLTSGWTIAALIVLGATMVWVCRRKRRHDLN